MSSSKSIEDLSFEELDRVFSFFRAGQKTGSPAAILVGGWAVYSYNAYFKSVDIDLLVDRAGETGLVRHLVRHHGYAFRRLDDDGPRKLLKHFEQGVVVVDFLNPNIVYPFPERSDGMSFSFVRDRYGGTVLRPLGIPVPDRTALLVTKIRAAWDRSARLRRYKCPDKDYEERKVIKDYSDIVALIDPEFGGNDIEIDFLDGILQEYPFLRSVFLDCEVSGAAADKYRKPVDAFRSIVRRLTGQLRKPTGF